MKIPVQVTFRDMPISDAVEASCWKEAAKLERYYDRVIGCRIVVAPSYRGHHQGKLFEIRIELTVPGRELVVKRQAPQHHAHEEINVAIRDAFDCARRQLQEYARRQRGEVKAHAPPRRRLRS
ncbi:MAG: HPF/RaiA family ribosome-associated protein [Planctomycetota bacterium]|jgi:ribosome-associated translation inhibitor RaiA